MADDGIELIYRVLCPWREAQTTVEHEVEVRVIACDSSVESIF